MQSHMDTTHSKRCTFHDNIVHEGILSLIYSHNHKFQERICHHSIFCSVSSIDKWMELLHSSLILSGHGSTWQWSLQQYFSLVLEAQCWSNQQMSTGSGSGHLIGLHMPLQQYIYKENARSDHGSISSRNSSLIVKWDTGINRVAKI